MTQEYVQGLEPIEINTLSCYEGLDKRGQIAAMVLQSLVVEITNPEEAGAAQTSAKLAVQYADALIEELNKGENHE